MERPARAKVCFEWVVQLLVGLSIRLLLQAPTIAQGSDFYQRRT